MLGEILKTYRHENHMSQDDLASLLGIKQTTISRIELGTLKPSQELAMKIRKLRPSLSSSELGTSAAKSKKTINNKISYHVHSRTIAGFQFSWTSFSPGTKSGDVCRVDKLKTKKEALFLIVDAVGHGNEAYPMNLGVQTAYLSALSLLSELVVEPEILYRAINSAIRNTEHQWIGSPSLIIGRLTEHALEFVNNGQPDPIAMINNKIRTLEPDSVRGSYTIDESPAIKVTPISLSSGDSVMFYTDGLRDLFSRRNKSTDLSKKFESTAKLLKGDSNAILKELLDFVPSGTELSPEVFTDDCTILIISRRRR